MNPKPLYQIIASTIDAYKRCIESGNTEWESKHASLLRHIEKNLLPSGSGFDSGTDINLDASNGDKLVFHTSFHHMDPNGYYDGWTDHTVKVTPSLVHDIALSVSGRDRNQIKEMIADEFSACLKRKFTYNEKGVFILHTDHPTMPTCHVMTGENKS